ncbi:MAG: BamA/TamA family outer membrane protein [bacterium]|nr:BamA/TamA family outer membrane protein [bacterium]
MRNRYAILVAMLASVVWTMSGPTSAVARPPATAPDSASVAASADTVTAWRWGPAPVPSVANTRVMRDRPQSDWEAALLGPYHLAGLPFRALHLIGDGTIDLLDSVGIFDLPPSDYRGFPGPWGTYVMPFFAVESLEGTKFGLNVTRPYFLGRENILFVTGDVSTHRSQKVGGGVLFGLGPHWDLQVGAGTEEVPAVRYYGLGHDSSEGDLSYYFRGSAWAGFELERNLGRGFGVVLRPYYSRLVTKESGYRTHQSLGKVHTDLMPPGFPGESAGWTFRFSLDRDTTGELARPSTGEFSTVGASPFLATDGSGVRFVKFHASTEHFVPLWHTGRTLAARGFFSRIANMGDEPIPFSRLETFTRPDVLRGFRDLRYYGVGSLGFTLEYRWPIWNARNRNGPGVDAYLFSDTGQVFEKTSDISYNNLELTGGCGLRVLGDGGGFSARVELGLSDEEPVLRFKFSQTFQYRPKVLLHGKDPTRRR